jgi:hypothetical protein
VITLGQGIGLAVMLAIWIALRWGARQFWRYDKPHDDSYHDRD